MSRRQPSREQAHGTGRRSCAWRRPVAGRSDRVVCSHPGVHARDGVVGADICDICSYVDGASETKRWRFDADGRARAGGADGPWKWSLGVTTAEREIDTLGRCLRSLRRTGWDDPRIFAEPGVQAPQGFEHLPISKRDETLGAFPNWYLGLSELLMREPDADAYLMAQDDAIFAAGLRSYLEDILWPAAAVGVISIYSPSHYSLNRGPGLHMTNRGWSSWGALGYIFPNHAARLLLSDHQVLDHRRKGPNGGLRNVDSVVGAWCARASLPYFVHVPSLVQHIGDSSTLYPDASATGRRVASDFVADVRQLIDTGHAARPANER